MENVAIIMIKSEGVIILSNENCEGLSVIIPVYNSEKYLADCLDSIINQEYKNLEIICINDGSTDSSAQILDAYAKKDNRIIVIHNENKGVAAARNCGIDNATMPFITFVDSDDTIDSKMYSKMIKAISNDKLDCVCCNYQKVFLNGKTLTIKSRFKNRVLYNEEIREEIVKCLIGFSNENNNCLSCLWNKIFVLDVINKNNIRINEKRSHGEDWMFCIEYYAAINSIGFVEDALYNYIFRQNSLVGKPRSNAFEVTLEANKLFKKLFPEFEWKSEAKVFEENNRPIENALYYRNSFNGSQTKQLFNKIYSICKEENYYADDKGLNKTQQKLKIALENDDVNGFIKCLERATLKDYIVYKLKMAIRKLIKG